MYYHHFNHFFYLSNLLLVSLLIFLIGCGSHKSSSLTIIPVLYGTPHTVTVNTAVNETVSDPVSGLAFMLPQGGTGTLTITPITQAPARPMSGGQGFRVDGLMNVPVALKYSVPTGGQERQLLVLTPAAGCYTGITRPTQDWYCLPARDGGDGFIYFDLPKTVRGRQDAPFYDDYWSYTVDPPANATDMRIQVTHAINAVLTALPGTDTTGLRGTVRARSQEEPLWHYYRLANSGSFYTYGRVFGHCIYLAVDNGQKANSHETGHYMTNMFMTDAQWATLQANTPQTHSTGQAFSRDSALTEDYAYFLQWFSGYNDVNCTNAYSLYGRDLSPTKTDAPSMEGFTALLLGYLTQTKSPCLDFVRGSQSEVPIIGATPGEVAALISNADMSLNALYPHLVQFVTARGYYVDTLAVLAERCGWSYSGNGTVTYNGQPAVGATVQPVITYEKGTWSENQKYTYTTPTATVDAKGKYILPRIFYGNILLRVTYNGTTKDIPYTVNREIKTNVVLTIPPIELGDSKPVINSITPETAMPDDIVTITGSNFGATKPLGGDVYIYPAYSTGTINPEITYWSDTAIRIKVPYGVDAPTRINVYNGTVGANPARWLYIGDGHTFLGKLKSYESVQIGEVHDLIGYQGGNSFGVFANPSGGAGWTTTHSIVWDGANFTATQQRNGLIWVTGTISSGVYEEQVTITGTVDPVRQVLLTVNASLRQEISGSAILTNDVVTVFLKMQNLSGYREDSGFRIPFGYFQGKVDGFPPIPITTNTVVSYHYQKQSTGEDYVTPYNNQMYYQTDRQVVFSNL